MRRLQAIAFVALFFVQVLPAATVAWQQTRRLATGRPITLAVDTRDPRDLFRGEYSTLTYEISNLSKVDVATAGLGDACDLIAQERCDLGRGRAVYVKLAADPSGVDRATQVTFEKPAKGDTFIAGTLAYGSLTRQGAGFFGATCERPVCIFGHASFGIESWYGAQGKPAQLDQAARKDVRVEARVDDEGHAVLNKIEVGGQTFAETARLWH